MDWSFLDKADKNLLYMYAQTLIKDGKHHNTYIPSETGNEERDAMLDAEAKRKSAYYIIWFVYRYILGCETLEEAKKYATMEVLKKYKIASFFSRNQARIYLGIYGINEMYLYNFKGGDLDIVLEILYNRYDYIEQLECFIRRTEGTARSLHNRCRKTLEQSLTMMQGSVKCKELLRKYEEKKNENNQIH